MDPTQMDRWWKSRVRWCLLRTQTAAPYAARRSAPCEPQVPQPSCVLLRQPFFPCCQHHRPMPQTKPPLTYFDALRLTDPKGGAAVWREQQQ